MQSSVSFSLSVEKKSSKDGYGGVQFFPSMTCLRLRFSKGKCRNISRNLGGMYQTCNFFSNCLNKCFQEVRVPNACFTGFSGERRGRMGVIFPLIAFWVRSSGWRPTTSSRFVFSLYVQKKSSKDRYGGALFFTTMTYLRLRFPKCKG